MTNISWHGWLLKTTKFEASLIHAVNLHLSNSSRQYILDCILVESAKLNKLENKLRSNFPDGRDSLITRA